jgi:DNA polymerase III delta subunit
MKKPRLYLFHGSDTQQSRGELVRWLTAFGKKYGTATQYRIEAGGVSYDEVVQRLVQALQTDSLFAEPKLLVLEYFSASFKPAQLREMLTFLSAGVHRLDEAITIVWWDDRRLAENNPVRVWFAEHTAQGTAEIKEFQVQTVRQQLKRLLAQDVVTPEAGRWLEEYSARSEREQRMNAKLRANEAMVQDMRGWELNQLIEQARLLTPEGASLDVPALEQVALLHNEVVSPFTVVNAVARHDWEAARTALRQLNAEDSNIYFVLLQALVRHARALAHGEERSRLLGWLAEIELVSKNLTLPLSWLFELLFLRAQLDERGGGLLDPRRVWLTHVQRVGTAS